MGHAFPEDVELPLEVFFVKMAALADMAVSIVRMENDERLANDGFGAAGGRSKDGAISWETSRQPRDSEAEVPGDVGKMD